MLLFSFPGLIYRKIYSPCGNVFQLVQCQSCLRDGTINTLSNIDLDESSGRARLWGRWHRGRLADARLALDIGRLAVSHADEGGERHAIELSEVEGRGQWLRRDDGWEAWFEGDAVSSDATEPDDLEAPWGPALPHRWQLAGDADGWWLDTSAFDVGSLAKRSIE